MSPKALLVFALAPWFATLLSAQQPAGLLTGVPPASVQPTTIGVAVGAELLARIPAESYRGLGQFVTPSLYRVHGAIVHLRDTTLVDGEVFDVFAYLEAGQSNLPTVPANAAPGTTAVASVLGLTTPAGFANHTVPVTFPAPIDVPVTSDLFVAIVPRSPGLRLRAVAGTSAPGLISSQLDSCGAGLVLGASYLLLHDAGAVVPLTTGTVGWQAMVDLLVDGPSGVAVSAIDGNLPVTASLFSGLHPDVADPPNQTARHDVPGYVFRGNGTVPTGSPVFLLGSLDPFVAGPWVVLSPGNAVLHLSLANAFPLRSAVTDGSGDALLLVPVPQSSMLRGLGLATQAFAFDLGNSAVRAGAAVRQRL